MRRISQFIGLSAMLLIAIILIRPKSPKEEWTDYLKNHPYNKNVDFEHIKELPKQDRPDLAMQQNFLMTVDPKSKEVPVNRLVEAFENQRQIRRSRSSTKSAIPGVNWVERGPNNVGGRTRALMWDPNDSNNEKLWAAGVAGGIWFNNNVTDANTSWQNVNDFMQNLAVTTLAYDPTNTQVFYAGTGEGYSNSDAVRGAGIFKSTDGGASWSQLSATNTSTFHYVQRVVVTSSGTILASTRSGLHRSINGGDSWTEVLSATSSGASTSRANDIDIASNGDIYASLGIFSSGSVHRSTDDGATWTAITPSEGSPQRIELAVAPSASSTTATTVIYAVASSGSNVDWFKKSSDGGDNWSDITIPKYRSQSCVESSSDFTRGQAWYDLALAVSPTDSDVILAGGINVSRSSDGGTNMAEVSYWTGGCDSYVHADVHNIVFRPNHPSEAVIGSDGGVSYSANVGSSSNPTFSDRNKDYNVTQFYAVAAQNDSDVGYFIGGTQDNGTHKFTDAGGMTTVSINGGDGAFCFIDQDDNNYQISSYVYNVYDLHNSTGTIVQNLVDNQNKGRFINPADYDNTADILYSAGDGDELMRISGISTTPNAQETLSVSLDGGRISTIRADAYQANRIFVGTGGSRVYRIDDANGTPTVTNITSNISTSGYISSIDIGTSDDELIVTFSNYGVSSVWYTTDGGSSWTDKDNDGSLSDIPVRWALFNPNNTKEVLLATELGVWSTTDISATNPGWEQSSNNLANVRCDMLQYRSSDNLVIVATHGRGVYTSNVFDGLATPSDLIIEESAGSITLNWVDNSIGEENYIVERSVGDESSYGVVATLDPDTETYTESVPGSNQTLFYRVYSTSASKGDSRTVDSNILSLPSVPTIEASTDVSSSEFTINWTVTDNTDRFILDVSEVDDFSTFVPGYEKIILTGVTSRTVTNRPSGTYYFRVAASNTSGDSDFSAAGSVMLDPLSVATNQIVPYPNPTEGRFLIRGLDARTTFEMFNIMGQKVDFEVIEKADGFEFDISNLQGGSYLLKLNDNSGTTTKTILKK